MHQAATAATDFFPRHRELLERAVAACAERDYWSPFVEAPSARAYGADAPEEGEAAFRAHLDSPFPLAGQPGTGSVAGREVSPYGFELGVSYPRITPREAVAAAGAAAARGWRSARPETRAGVAAEILVRLNAASFEMAHAVQHTTGQPFVMAFQAGGPHAQDRGLEAVAYAFAEQLRHPATARWTKPQRKGDPLALEKTFTPVGRGVAVLIACNTFPTWNGYPGLFASLVTGNPVVVKPHPRAVLPLAITVRIAREVLAEAGFDRNVVILAPEDEQPTAADLATHPDVRIVDFTGSTEFGDWLEANARQATVYTEKAGLNTVLVDGTHDYRGLLRNLAFSLSLYSGQMCTAPQNILLPRDGIDTDQGRRTADEFATDLGGALDALLGDDRRAAGTLGAIVNDGVLKRLAEAGGLGRVPHPSRELPHPEYPDATLRTPLVARLDADADHATYTREWFGPVSFVIGTDSTPHSLDVFRDTVRRHGALTATVHATDEAVLDAARSAALDAGVHLSENLTGGVFVNQSAAFSDFHGTPANPAASAALTDPAFVTGRFTVLQSRRHVPVERRASAEAAADA